jgi:hypothetical protein
MANLKQGNFPLLTYRNIDVQTTGSIIKAYAGGIFDLTMSNANAAIRYVKLYDKATAPTASDTPVRTYLLPPSSTVVVPVPDGINYTTGISIRASTGVADNDNTAPSANDVIVDIGYL